MTDNLLSMFNAITGPDRISQSNDPLKQCLIVDTLDHLPLLRTAAKGNVLEIGVDVGHTTTALLLGVLENGGHLFSMDIRDVPCANVFREFPDFSFIHEDSKRFTQVLGRIPAQLDVLYVDGDHSYEGARADLFNYGKLVRPGGLVLVHDVHHPDFPGVNKAFYEWAMENASIFSYREGSWGLGVARVA